MISCDVHISPTCLAIGGDMMSVDIGLDKQFSGVKP